LRPRIITNEVNDYFADAAMTKALQSPSIRFLALCIGLLLDNLLHLYRFWKIGWTHITGLFGQPQPLLTSLSLSFWPIVLMFLAKPLSQSLATRKLRVSLLGLCCLVFNQAAGRSILKLIFDTCLLGVLFFSVMLEMLYENRPPPKTGGEDASLLHNELMNLFQTTLIIITFVIATFGFAFAPSYLEKYYTTDIGQPTVWWFSLMTMYITAYMIIFISVRCWEQAMNVRMGKRIGQ